MAGKSKVLYSLDHLLDLLKRKVRAQQLQLHIRKLMRVIYQTCASFSTPKNGLIMLGQINVY